jgi:hypothetical protein
MYIFVYTGCRVKLTRRQSTQNTEKKTNNNEVKLLDYSYCLLLLIFRAHNVLPHNYDVYIHQQMSLCGRDVDLIRLFRIMSIPTTFSLFLVLTSEQIGRQIPVFMLLLLQRQHVIVVDAVDYK